jgi:hypothetical protein
MEEILGNHGIVYRCKDCKTLQRVPRIKGLKVNFNCLKCDKQGTLERCSLHIYDGRIDWVAKSDPLPDYALYFQSQENQKENP